MLRTIKDFWTPTCDALPRLSEPWFGEVRSTLLALLGLASKHMMMIIMFIMVMMIYDYDDDDANDNHDDDDDDDDDDR